MGYEVLQETPLSVEKMSNIDGIIWSLSPEYENALLFLSSLEKLNDFDACTGIWLARLGPVSYTHLISIKYARGGTSKKNTGASQKSTSSASAKSSDGSKKSSRSSILCSGAKAIGLFK